MKIQVAKTTLSTLALTIGAIFFYSMPSPSFAEDNSREADEIRIDGDYAYLTISDRYELRDTDTEHLAKKILINKIKDKASERMGGYVRSISTLIDGDLFNNKIKIIADGYIEVVKTHSKFEVSSDGRMVLVLTADVRANKLQMRNEFSKLVNANSLYNKYIALKDENERLKKAIINLDAEVKVNNTPQAANKGFYVDGGSLLINATKKENEKAFLETRLEELMIESADGYNYKLMGIDVEKKDNGRFDVFVRVDYALPNADRLDELNQLLFSKNVSHARKMNVTKKYNYWGRDLRIPMPTTRDQMVSDAWKYLGKINVVATVSMGGKVVDRQLFVRAKKAAIYDYKVSWREERYGKPVKNRQFVFKDLTKQEIAKINQVEFAVKVINLNERS